jgi:flagellar operon protein
MDKMKMMNGLSRIENLIPRPTDVLDKNKTEAGEFQKALEQSLQEDGSGSAVADVGRQIAPPPGARIENALRFSNHAIERMQTRGISYTPESLGRLEDAVKKAAAKGSKDTLVLMDDSALIVSVKNNTVVTVMDKNALKENVFTNIDSTVVI